MKTLYLSDIDGTLIRSSERISDYTITTINRFIREGGCFSYATARSIVSASKVTAGLNTPFPVICYSVALIIDSESRNVLHGNYFTKEEERDIRRILTEQRILPIVFSYINGRERFSFIERNVSVGMRAFLDKRRDDIRCREVQSEDELYDGDNIFYITCIRDDKTEFERIHNGFKADPRVQIMHQKDLYSVAQWC